MYLPVNVPLRHSMKNNMAKPRSIGIKISAINAVELSLSGQKQTSFTSLMSPFPWIFQPFLNRKSEIQRDNISLKLL